jgi:hypothetical protein
LNGASSDKEFYATILLEQASWTFHGAAGMLKRPARPAPSEKALADETFRAWKMRLLEQDVLPVRQPPGCDHGLAPEPQV